MPPAPPPWPSVWVGAHTAFKAHSQRIQRRALLICSALPWPPCAQQLYALRTRLCSALRMRMCSAHAPQPYASYALTYALRTTADARTCSFCLSRRAFSLASLLSLSSVRLAICEWQHNADCGSDSQVRIGDQIRREQRQLRRLGWLSTREESEANDKRRQQIGGSCLTRQAVARAAHLHRRLLRLLPGHRVSLGRWSVRSQAMLSLDARAQHAVFHF